MSTKPRDPKPGPLTEGINILAGFPVAKTTVIFRRFDELAVRNLFHLEAGSLLLKRYSKRMTKTMPTFRKKISRSEPQQGPGKTLR
jgi:hypothetical protein